MPRIKTYGELLEMLRDPMSELPNLPLSPEQSDLERELGVIRRELEVLAGGERIPRDTLLTEVTIDAAYNVREIYDKHFKQK